MKIIMLTLMLFMSTLGVGVSLYGGKFDVALLSFPFTLQFGYMLANAYKEQMQLERCVKSLKKELVLIKRQNNKLKQHLVKAPLRKQLVNKP